MLSKLLHFKEVEAPSLDKGVASTSVSRKHYYYLIRTGNSSITTIILIRNCSL